MPHDRHFCASGDLEAQVMQDGTRRIVGEMHRNRDREVCEMLLNIGPPISGCVGEMLLDGLAGGDGLGCRRLFAEPIEMILHYEGGVEAFVRHLDKSKTPILKDVIEYVRNH